MTTTDQIARPVWVPPPPGAGVLRLLDADLQALHRRSAVAVGALAFSVLLAASDLLINSHHIALGRDLVAGADVADGRLAFADDLDLAIGPFLLLAFAASAVCVIRWLHHAAKVVVNLRRPLRYSPGWAIGAWFVPFLNLWRPVHLVNDVDAAGLPDGRRTPLVAWWWAAWLVSQAVGNGAGRLYLSVDGPEDYLLAAQVYAVSDALEVVAGLLAAFVVLSVTRRLAARLSVERRRLVDAAA